MTTSLSRGIWSVRFLRLCSLAPPMRMNSLLTGQNVRLKLTGKPTIKILRRQKRVAAHCIIFNGRDAALRRLRPPGRNERAKTLVFPSPDAVLGDGDSVARCPYRQTDDCFATRNFPLTATAAR